MVDSGYVGEGANETQWVKFPDGSLGYFKAVGQANTSTGRNYGHTDPAEGALHEVAAWRVTKAMGPPWSAIVPVCVVREVNGELGSLAAGVKGAQFPTVTRDAGHRAAVFDALIGNQDRHPATISAIGPTCPPAPRTWPLIDHGYAFGVPGDRLNYSAFVSDHAGEPLDQADRASSRWTAHCLN